MTSSTPVTGGTKALAIINIVFGSLVFLTTTFGIVGASYILATGSSLGQDKVRNIMKSVSRDQGQMVEDYDDAVKRQTDHQKEVAPFQLATFIPYALAVAVCIAISAFLLTGRGSRAWLARAAMAACLVRLGVAVAEYRAVAAVPEAWKQGWDRGFARGSKGRPPPEGLKEMGSAFATVGQTLIVATVAGQAFFVSGYWGVVAFVFTRKNKASAAPVVVP